MDVYVEPHLSWRLLTPDDTDELDAFRGQLDALEDSVLTGVAATITDADLLVVTAVGGFDRYESLSAYGIVYLDQVDPLRMYLMGGVHPTHRHMRVGTALLNWQVAQATAWRDDNRPGVPLWLGCYAEVGRPGLERAATKLGFTPERYSFDLQRDLKRPIPLPDVEGITVVPFPAERSDEVRRLHNVCFEDVGSEVSPETWAGRLSGPEFRPGWSFVAKHGDRIVAYAMSGVADAAGDGPQIGWVERFGVHPEFRGRRIATSVLARCLTAMKEAGFTEAGIGIDTPDARRAEHLCSELGWTTRDGVALLTKVVP